jgi:hypothetical protein
MYIGLHVNYLSSDKKETSISFKNSRKILTYQISWKFVQQEPSCSLRADRQRHIKTLTIAFRNFSNASQTQNLDLFLKKMIFYFSEIYTEKVQVLSCTNLSFNNQSCCNSVIIPQQVLHRLRSTASSSNIHNPLFYLRS